MKAQKVQPSLLNVLNNGAGEFLTPDEQRNAEAATRPDQSRLNNLAAAGAAAEAEEYLRNVVADALANLAAEAEAEAAAAEAAYRSSDQYMADMAESRGRVGPAQNVKNNYQFNGLQPQIAEQMDTDGLPIPGWLRSLQNNIDTLMSIKDRVIPLDLVRKIRSCLDPTPEQIEEQRRLRQHSVQRAHNTIRNMQELLIRIQSMATTDPRYQEALEFAQYFAQGRGAVYISSAEAPGRLTGDKSLLSAEDQQKAKNPSGTSASQPTEAFDTEDRTIEMMGPDPRPYVVSPLEAIVNMAGEKDDQLRGWGIFVRFFMWDPRGPGAEGLVRCWIVYDGVIEPSGMRAIPVDNNVEFEAVTDFTVLYARSRDRPITAEAVAKAEVISSSVNVVVSGQSTESSQQRKENNSTQFPATRTEDGRSLLKIPITYPTKIWADALYWQTFIKHEDPVDPSILAVHFRAIECRFGPGGSQHRGRSFWELSMVRPLITTYDSVVSIGAKCFGNIRQGAADAATRICDALGVDDSHQQLAAEMLNGLGGTRIRNATDIKMESDRLSNLIANARRLASNARRRERIRSGIITVGNAAVVVSAAATKAATKAAVAASKITAVAATEALEVISTHLISAAGQFAEHARQQISSQPNELSVKDRILINAEHLVAVAKYQGNQSANIALDSATAAFDSATATLDAAIIKNLIDFSSIARPTKKVILAGGGGGGGGGGGFTVECSSPSLPDQLVVTVINPSAEVIASLQKVPEVQEVQVASLDLQPEPELSDSGSEEGSEGSVSPANMEQFLQDLILEFNNTNSKQSAQKILNLIEARGDLRDQINPQQLEQIAIRAASKGGFAYKRKRGSRGTRRGRGGTKRRIGKKSRKGRKSRTGKKSKKRRKINTRKN